MDVCDLACDHVVDIFNNRTRNTDEFLMKDLIDVTIDDDDWRDEKAANVGPRNKRDTLTEASSELAGIADDEAENNACKTSSLKRHK